MTPTQKKLISLLLRGHYAMKVPNGYRVYDKAVNPVMRISEKTFRSITKFIEPKIKIWKKDIRGRITLNLSMVRKLRANQTIKVLYKNRGGGGVEQLMICPVRKTKSSKKIINEKACTLF